MTRPQYEGPREDDTYVLPASPGAGAQWPVAIDGETRHNIGDGWDRTGPVAPALRVTYEGGPGAGGSASGAHLGYGGKGGSVWVPPMDPAPRHRLSDDIPGPSRARLAQLLRQVRALVVAVLAGQLGYAAYVAWWYLTH